MNEWTVPNPLDNLTIILRVIVKIKQLICFPQINASKLTDPSKIKAILGVLILW